VADPVGMAAVGLGWWGGVLAEAVKGVPEATLASCFARTPTARRRFAADHECRAASSWDELQSDPEVEALLIATPHSTHAELVADAATAGKHVFVEKPLTLSVADGRRALKAVEAADVVLQVGHNRRRQPGMRRLRKLVAEGELGIVHHVEANLSNPKGLNPRTGWRGDPTESPGGGMTGLGVHMADNLIYLVGRPRRLAAFSKQIVGVSKLDDATTIMLEFESGPLGLIGTSMVVPDVARTAAFGTKASAYNECDGDRFFVQRVGERDRTELAIDNLDTVHDQLGEFARCIRGGGEPETGGKEALEVVAVLEATMESVATGGVVELDDVRSRA
jgi:predicted dehydrogenase